MPETLAAETARYLDLLYGPAPADAWRWLRFNPTDLAAYIAPHTHSAERDREPRR
jgi:hypothetical protein